MCTRVGKDSNTGTLSEQPPDIQKGIRNVLPDINPAVIITRFVHYSLYSNKYNHAYHT